ncbi:MAG: pilus assembly protein [Gammaproteobacteria bacterium]|nr:pilus assembly protein [Gammaproteobacteria bacterium]NIW47432.1 hypothetical protein [Gammaproteobacteria bacterium]NIX55968.1 hypothetical protein [candidate division Zixibacteria bacterium]
MKTDQEIRLHLHGQSFVEFAITLPLLLLLLFGAIDLGRAFHAAIALTNSAREGARYGSIYPDATDAEIGAAVYTEMQNSGLDLSSSTITRSCYKDGVIVNTLPSGEACESNAPIKVTVTYDFQLIMGRLFSMENIILNRHVEMLVP